MKPTDISLVEYFQTAGKLKEVVRTGWTRYPINNPESVADHSFRTAIMAMTLAPYFDINANKVIKMALIHDIADSIMGDIVTDAGSYDLPNLKQKEIDEVSTGEKIFDIINAADNKAILTEFINQESPEAKFVSQLDKLEMAMQAREYEIRDNVNLSDFFVSAKRKISDEQLKSILDTIININK